MQDMDGKPIRLHGKPAEFKAQDFTATNFATAEEKAMWANKFTKFILGGFQRSSFKKEVYKQLQHMFGHCAEYDLNGFYLTWFETTYKCLHWVETIATTWLAGIGQAQYTWSDVEIKVIQWMRDNHIHDQVAGYLQTETEQKERAALQLLQERYGVIPAAADMDELTGDAIAAQLVIPTPSQELGQLRLF